MPRILSVSARQILDSRGCPTVQAELRTKKGFFSAMVPSGASTGRHEAIELRDGGKAFSGKGVSKAVSNVNSIIAKKVSGNNFSSQEELDNFLIALDGSPDKSKLGANSVLAVSMAFSRACAEEQGMQLHEFFARISGNKKFVLPVPLMNVVNGGKHAGRENDFQEHMLVPSKFRSFSEALRAGTETYHALKKILEKKFGWQAALLGDEGGFAPPIESAEQRLELMLAAVEDAGYSGKIKIALDCASSEFFDVEKGEYNVSGKKYSSAELIDYYSELVSGFGVVSIEDGMAEDDWEGWKEMNRKLGKKVQLVGDDLLVTNVKRIEKAIKQNSCNSLLLKINQIGTVSESVSAARLAARAGWKAIVSHRSGETEDSFIASLCVGLGCGQCKFGAPARSERTAKYNELLRIEKMLLRKGRAEFGLKNVFG